MVNILNIDGVEIEVSQDIFDKLIKAGHSKVVRLDAYLVVNTIYIQS